MDNPRPQAQEDRFGCSSIAVKILAGQQPMTQEDKHTFFERPLHAQPEKSATSAESEAGAV